MRFLSPGTWPRWGPGGCVVGPVCTVWDASSIPGFYPLDASSIPFVRITERVQPLPAILWGPNQPHLNTAARSRGGTLTRVGTALEVEQARGEAPACNPDHLSFSCGVWLPVCADPS